MGQGISIQVLGGRAANRDVLLGFASARQLCALSFTDILDQDSGTGYQRRFSVSHSLDFRRYIQQPDTMTPPLTFNLRPRRDNAWSVEYKVDGAARLVISADSGPVLSQVDCQHRLGQISDLEITLPFMVFLGLSVREEMEVFNIINGKAKGLSSSLLDYHAARLARDLGREKPELFIALHLNDCVESPWYKQLDLGGKITTGLKRRASLRTMQKAVRRFLSATSILETTAPDAIAAMVVEYWIAVESVLHSQWRDPRRHFLTKGIGVYALLGLAADIWNESDKIPSEMTRLHFATALGEFAPRFDWRNDGPLKGMGGESGAQAALNMLRDVRTNSRFNRSSNGK